MEHGTVWHKTVVHGDDVQFGQCTATVVYVTRVQSFCIAVVFAWSSKFP